MKEKLSAEFWNMVRPAVEQRLEALQQISFENLKTLPEVADQGNEVINGIKITFCVHTWEHKPNKLIVVVQAATTPTYFFSRWYSYELGVVLEKNGSVREASSEEILSIL